MKSVSLSEVEMSGASIIVTAGNGKGKTTLLRSFFDRILESKNDKILKHGEEKGLYSIEFTDGNRVEWEFSEKSEKLTLITDSGLKVNSINQIKQYFFGKDSFDIDEFLQMSSRKQAEKLLKSNGIDISEIESKYNLAYTKRSELNKEFDILQKSKPEIIELTFSISDFEKLEAEIESKKAENKILISEYKDKEDKKRAEIEEQNKCFEALNKKKRIAISELDKLKDISELSQFIDLDAAESFVIEMQTYELLSYESEPLRLHNISEMEKDFQTKKIEIELYKNSKLNIEKWENKIKDKEKEVDDAKNEVNKLLNEKIEMLKSLHLPDGFSVESGELTYNGFPLDRKSQSTSGIYIAALKLATLYLGELRSLHFDCATLDKNSLKEVFEFAKSIDLQLLVERPDFDGGEIKYEIFQV